MANNVIFSSLYLGNFADIDTDETVDFDGYSRTENEDSLLGTYGSPASPIAQDKVDVRTDGPDNFLHEDNVNTDDTWSYDLGAGTVATGLDSMVIFNYSATLMDGSPISGFAYVGQMTNGDVFLFVENSQSALVAQGVESITLSSMADDRFGGFDQNSFNALEFVCFAPGTLIKTPGGAWPVEDLRESDLVETLDHGPQRLVWTGARHLRFPPSPARQKPMRFAAGCFGPGLPNRDLVVSPQHALLCQTERGERLAVAKGFETMGGVRRMAGKREVIYHSLLFERHEIVFANGLAVESLYPGPQTLCLLTPAQRLQVIAALPGAAAATHLAIGPRARPRLRYRETMQEAAAGRLLPRQTHAVPNCGASPQS